MKNLLLVIDMQKGFRYPESETILPNILKLKDLFKERIIFSKFINNKNSLFERQLNWIKFQGNKDRDLFSELQTPNNIEIEHNSYTILNKELKEFIDKNKITEIYLCRVYTDVSIIKTAMDLFDNNIKVFIIEDACGSLHRGKNHDAAINSLKHILGEKQIISTTDIQN